MFIIGAYPDSFLSRDSYSPIYALSRNIDLIAPREVAVHLLPFYPHSGDGGFAPNNWFQIRPDFGNWDEFKDLSFKRKLIIDCIYNHIGKEHQHFREFLDSPDSKSELLYAFKKNIYLTYPRSPRGRSVMCDYKINNEEWQLWQTFSDASVDIRLDNPLIQKEIDEHLNFMVSNGIWGVRLDGIAYYGKEPGSDLQRHHPDSYRLGRIIADKALSRNLYVNAQLDCDNSGLKYFPKSIGYNISIVDYSYSAYLLHVIFTNRIDAIAKHLQKTWHYPLIRCPRTHDGILLRSANLDSLVKDELIGILTKYGIVPIVIDGSYYEYNCSLPYLLSLGIGKFDLYKRIQLATALTGFLPGDCYLYLHFLIGYIPEYDYKYDPDLRSMNRQPISDIFIDKYLESSVCSSTFKLIKWLIDLHENIQKVNPSEDGVVECLNNDLLSISRKDSKLQMILNFSSNSFKNVSDYVSGSWVNGMRSSQASIDPLGFGVWTCK